MFCPTCGSPNPVSSSSVVQCGACGYSFGAAASDAVQVHAPRVHEPLKPVASHLALAIVCTAVGAMLFLPLAIAGGIAILHATKVSTKLAQGDLAGAERASKTALWTSVIGLGLASTLVIGFCTFLLVLA